LRNETHSNKKTMIKPSILFSTNNRFILLGLSFIFLSLFISFNGWAQGCGNNAYIYVNGHTTNPLSLCNTEMSVEGSFDASKCIIQPNTASIRLYKDGNDISNIAGPAIMEIITNSPGNQCIQLNYTFTFGVGNPAFGSGSYMMQCTYTYTSLYDYQDYTVTNSSTLSKQVNLTIPGWEQRLLSPTDPANTLDYLTTNNNNNLFYKGTDNKIWVDYLNGSTWATKLLVPGAPANVSGYVIAKRNANVVYYQGTDNRINCMDFNTTTGAWEYKELVPTQPADVNGYLTTNDDNNIYYRDFNNKISCVTYSNGWTYRGELVPSQPGDVAGDVVTKRNGLNIYYRSTAGQIACVTYVNNVGWTYRAALDPTAPANVAGYLTTNDDLNVYYKGTDNKIWCVYFDNSLGRWTNRCLVPTQPANVADNVVCNAGLNVYYRGTDNKIWVVDFNAGTGAWECKIVDPTAPANAAGSVTAVSNTSIFNIFYKGADNKNYVIDLVQCPPGSVSRVGANEPQVLTNSVISGNKFSSYPTPFTNEINFNYLLEENAKVEFIFINSIGEIIRKEETIGLKGANTVKFDVSTLNNGFYYITMVVNGNIKDRIKIVK
jgi:hypothetical protein